MSNNDELEKRRMHNSIVSHQLHMCEPVGSMGKGYHCVTMTFGSEAAKSNSKSDYLSLIVD